MCDFRFYSFDIGHFEGPSQTEVGNTGIFVLWRDREKLRWPRNFAKLDLHYVKMLLGSACQT